jgi:hypothetical protein
MGNTANNNWPYPESTDLVKDGATAIENLADAIDTTLGVYSDPGLVLLNTTSFSGVASQDITFGSSTYDNYKFIYVATAGSGDVGLRLGTGGSFNSTSGNYRYNFQYAVYTSGTIVGGSSGASATNWIIGNAAAYGTIIDVYSPFATKNSAYTWQSARDDGGYMNGGGTLTVTTSYDQIRFVGLTGNITGTIYTYGYNK